MRREKQGLLAGGGIDLGLALSDQNPNTCRWW